MKITNAHLAVIKQAIDKLLLANPLAVSNYEAGLFPRSEACKDLQRRFCFDLMNGAGLTTFICKNIYSYANDDHIYTALKSICPKVTKKY